MPGDFIENGWYAAGWSEDFSRTLVERTICGVPIVFFRRLDGSLAALDGTCPHRAYPLALGRLDGDVLQCGYHGLSFDGSGTCVRVPGTDRIQAALHLASYPIEERGGLAWIWIGDRQRADRDLIFERWLAKPHWTSVHGTKYIRCRPQLLIENLLDLSHETFLHAGSIGETAIVDAPIDLTVDDRHVSAKRVIPDVAPAPLFVQAGVSGRIDRYQDAQYWAPGLCLTLARAIPRSPGEPTLQWSVIHCVTPETASTTHYFWAVARDYQIDDERCSETWRSGADRIFDQDVAALEAQEQRISRLPPDFRELSIPYDAAPLASRKLNRSRR